MVVKFRGRKRTIGRFPRLKTKKGAIRFHVDLPMILIFSTLIIFGLLMVFSASYDYSFKWYGNPSTIFIRQLIWMGLGLVGMLVLTFVDYHILGRYAVWAMAVTIFLLIAVLIANEVRNGASRTIYQGSVQPSELAKLVLVIYLSVWLTSRREQLGELGFGLIPLALIVRPVGRIDHYSAGFECGRHYSCARWANVLFGRG